MVQALIGRPTEKLVCGCEDEQGTNAEFFTDACFYLGLLLSKFEFCSFAPMYKVHLLEPDLTEIYFSQQNGCD